MDRRVRAGRSAATERLGLGHPGLPEGETKLAQRNPEANITVLSGQIVDGNTFHVVTADTVGQPARLDGFTITDGLADGLFIDHEGAGLLVDAAHRRSQVITPVL